MSKHRNTKIRELYNGSTQSELAEALGISTGSARKVTKKLNIKRRIQKARPLDKNKENIEDVLTEKELKEVEKRLKDRF